MSDSSVASVANSFVYVKSPSKQSAYETPSNGCRLIRIALLLFDMAALQFTVCMTIWLILLDCRKAQFYGSPIALIASLLCIASCACSEQNQRECHRVRIFVVASAYVVGIVAGTTSLITGIISSQEGEVDTVSIIGAASEMGGLLFFVLAGIYSLLGLKRMQAMRMESQDSLSRSCSL